MTDAVDLMLQQPGARTMRRMHHPSTTTTERRTKQSSARIQRLLHGLWIGSIGFYRHCWIESISAASSNDNTNGKRNFKTQYQIDDERLIDLTNPLWREFHVYTGERRGPVAPTDIGRNSGSGGVAGELMDQGLFPIWNGKNLGVSSSKAMDDVDDWTSPPLREELFLPRGKQSQRTFRKRRSKFELRPREDTRGGSLSINHIPAGWSNRRRNVVAKEQGNSTDQHRQAVQVARTTSTPRRTPSLPTPPPRGKLNVDLFDPFNPTSSSPFFAAEATNATVSEANVETNSFNTTSTAVTVQTPPSDPQQLQQKALPVMSRSSVSSKGNGNFHLGLSIDPASSIRLVHQFFVATVGILSAFLGTLRLVAPMIVAKRCLNIVGYFFYDHYNGRYLRTTYTKRMRHMQEYEVLAGLRSAARILLQALVVGIAGRLTGFVMDRSPCLIHPGWICSMWYGLVWVAAVYTTEWVTSLWLAVQVRYHLLSIRPTQFSGSTPARNFRPKRRLVGRQSFLLPPSSSSSGINLMELPHLVLQRLQDPEEWVDSMLRPIIGGGNNPRYYANNRYQLNSQKQHDKSIQLDTLLFPSTWNPLRLLTSVAVGVAIYRTLLVEGDGSSAQRTVRNSIMRSFVVQEIFHCEWLRVFVRERRVALGAVLSLLDLIAFLSMMIPVLVVDGTAGVVLLVPPLIARLVSGWMNLLLYYNRWGGPLPGFAGSGAWPFLGKSRA